MSEFSLAEEIQAVQAIWHEAFNDEYVPSDEYAARMIKFAGSASIVIDAIEICAENDNVACKSFDQRMSYTYGIMKNLRDPGRMQKWQTGE